MLTGRYRAGRRLPPGRRAVTVQVGLAVALLAAVATPGRMDASSDAAAAEASQVPSEPASDGVAHSGEPCIELRGRPGTSALIRTCLSDTSELSPIGRQSVERDGVRWAWVTAGSTRGWIAAALLDRLEERRGTPEVPPFMRDPGDGAGWADSPEPAEARTAGKPRAYGAPPPGGMVMGVAGTRHLDALIEAQPFPVEAVVALDLGTQRWLVHVASGPADENTLTSESLTPNMIVIVLRSNPSTPPPAPEVAAPAPAPAQPSEPVVRPAPEPASAGSEPAGSTGSAAAGGIARITYYYCERGSNPTTWGDGGGFCGAMRSGAVVYAGAAACSAANLGQRFTIVGDPTGRTYVCEDTGGGVHGNHRDIWFRNSDEGARWYAQVGSHAEIVIVD